MLNQYGDTTAAPREDIEELTDEAQRLHDSVHVLMKTARWAFVLALQEGFTTEQSLQISMHYITVMMGVGGNKK